MLKNTESMVDRTKRSRPTHAMSFGVNHPSTKKLADLGLVGGGISISPGPYLLMRNGKERPFHHMVVIVLEGELLVETPNDDLTAKEGDLIHIPSWTPRRIELIDSDTYGEAYFRFNAEPTCREFWTDKVVVRPSTELTALVRAVEGLDDEIGKGDAGLAALYAELVGRTLQREMSAVATGSAMPGQRRLGVLVQRIRNEPASDWTVQRLCRILHVSRTQLFRVFRQAFMKSPIQFVAEVRMNHAQQLLMTTDLPLDVIAVQVGYSNAYSFSNALVKYAGVRPGTLRRRLLGV